jgi:SMC interacting uncharacterized protein involved in chromosome segregation
MNWTVFSIIVSAIAILGTFILALVKYKPEARVDDTTSIRNLVEANKILSEENKTLQEEKKGYDMKIKKLGDDFETKFNTLQEANRLMQDEISKMRTELDLLKDHNDRLKHQVFSLGGDPVPFEKKPVASQPVQKGGSTNGSQT